MATWGDLKPFTWEELLSFSWDELLILDLNQLMYLKKVEVSENTQKQIDELEQRVQSLEKAYPVSNRKNQVPKAADSSFDKILKILSAAQALIGIFSSFSNTAPPESYPPDIYPQIEEISNKLETIIELLQEDNRNVIGQSNDEAYQPENQDCKINE